MPRSARLKNIAGGLCGSFASRNNDLDGYWSIGKLRLLADQHGQNTISFDLVTSSMQPASQAFAPVLARYRGLLARLADRSGIRREDITVALIAVDFAPRPSPRARYEQPRWGDRFVLTVSVSADGRESSSMHHAGYCRPHDPALESRSTRPSGSNLSFQ